MHSELNWESLVCVNIFGICAPGGSLLWKYWGTISAYLAKFHVSTSFQLVAHFSRGGT